MSCRAEAVASAPGGDAGPSKARTKEEAKAKSSRIQASMAAKRKAKEVAATHAAVRMQCVQAAQITFEDYFMADLHIEPLKIVGYEGVFGSIAMITVNFLVSS